MAVAFRVVAPQGDGGHHIGGATRPTRRRDAVPWGDGGQHIGGSNKAARR